jgi:hypothetical protein
MAIVLLSRCYGEAAQQYKKAVSDDRFHFLGF